MRSRQAKLLCKRMGLALAGIVTLVFLVWIGNVATDYWRVAHAISRFEAEPSQARVDVLVGLLEGHVPTARQGERILELILTPDIITRATYPPGSHPTIAMELPFVVPFRTATLAQREERSVQGGPPRTSESTASDVIRGIPRIQDLPNIPRRPGTYPVTLQQRYTLNLHHRETTWSWHPFRGPLPRSLLPYRNVTMMEFRSLEQWNYACSIILESEIVIAEKSQAETIELTSNPDLDEAMENAFTSSEIAMMRCYASPSGLLRATGGLRIIYRDLPEAVGFQPVLHLSDGREIKSDRHVSYRLHARAGRSGQFGLLPSVLLPETPGSYTGSILLRADPNSAYRDPAIKTIWDGTLEFPISFTITKEPNRQ